METYRIKEILSQKKLTQRWLAKKLGINDAQMTKMIKRDRLNDKTQANIASILGVRRCELFSDFVSDTVTIICPNCGHHIIIKTKI